MNNKNHPNITALSGYAGSGKDTVAKIIQYLTGKLPYKIPITEFITGNNWLVNSNNANFKIKKFADKPTQAFEIITGINFHKLNREEKENIRSKYIEFAEKCKDIFGEDIWVNSLMNDYKSAGEKCGFTSYSTRDIKEGFQKKPNWIISDLRFTNELKAIKDRGGICIRINRPGLIKNNHPSETRLDSAIFDYTIDNNSDINSLIEKVREILIKINVI